MKNRFTSVFATLLISCFILAASSSQSNAQATYCTPSNSSYTTYGINTVKSINGIVNFINSNSAFSTNGYGDFTASDTVAQMQGQAFKVQASGLPGSFGNTYHWAVWIDWNQDGDFDDAGEQVYVNNSSYSSSMSTPDILVPYSADTGNTRIRVIANYSGDVTGPCMSGSYIEGEDYTLHITPAPSCTGQPDAGVVLGSDTLHICSGVAFSLTDTGATGASNMTYQWQKRDPSGTGSWTDIAGATNFNIAFPAGLTSSVDYRFYVVCNNSNLSDTSNVITVAMNAPTDCYCDIDFSGNYSYYIGEAYINSVQTTGGTININNSNSGYNNIGYQDFRNTDTLRLMAGDQITLKPVLGSNATYPPYAGMMAWIDWNHDGDFDDPGENVASVAQQDISNSYASTFTVPITAQPGHTTLRVMDGVYMDNFDPCGVDIINDYYSWGEAEDYTIIVDSLPSCANATFPSSATASIDHDTLCVSGDVTLNLDTVLFFSGITYQWQKSSNGTSGWTDIGTGQIAPQLTVTGVNANTWYRCQIKCSGSTSLTSNVVSTHVSNPSMASAPTNGTRCGPGTVALTAHPSTGNTVNWYDQPTGGAPLSMNNNNYTTYYIPQTTVFYAASMGGTVAKSGWVGDGTDALSGTYAGVPLDNTASSLKMQTIIPASRMHSFGFNTAGYITALGFDVLAAGTADTLNDFTISMAMTGATTLSGGAWLTGNFQQVYFNADYTPQASSLNTYEFSTPFFWDGESNIVIEYCMHVSSTNATFYPGWSVKGDYSYYVYPDICSQYYSDYSSLTSSCNAAAPSSHSSYDMPNYYFKIRELCEGPREPDTAFVTPGPDFAIAYDTVVCNNSVNELQVTSPVTNYSQGYTWTALDTNISLYTDAAGTTPYVTGTNKSTIYFQSAVAGMHRIAVHASNGSLQTDCAAADTATFWVQPGNITILGMPDTICGGSSNPETQLLLMPGVGYSSGPYIQWQESADGITYNNIPSAQSTSYTTVPLYTNHYYKAVISAVAGVCETPDKLVVVANPVVTSTVDSSNCGPGTVVLQATTAGNSHPVWFDSDTSTTAIGSGSPFTTPFLTQTDTFYVAASGGAASTPGVATFGTGANSYSYSTYNPFYGSDYAKSDQLLIKKDELNAMGIFGGPIYSLGFNFDDTYTVTYGDLAVSMGSTTLSSLGAGSFVSGLQEVYGPQTTTISGSGWYTFNFTTPYNWDGTSNIVIQICWSNNGVYTTTKTVKGDNATFAATHYSYSYNAISADDICSHNISSGYDYTYNGRAQMQLGYFGPCESPRQMVIATINPKPQVDLGSDINKCVDSGAAVVLNAGVQPNSPQFLWNDGTTSQILSTNQSGTYSVTVTNSYDCATSDTVNVTLRHNPKVTLPDDTSVCVNTSVTLDAGPNGIQYFWNTGATTQTITVNTAGTYNVLVTNNDGCTVGDTVTVNMSGSLPSYDGIQITNDGYHTFKFNALNPQNVIGYDWDFGDGSPHQSDSVPVHTYIQEGNYIVTLTVMSGCGGYVDSTAAHILGIGQVNLSDDQLAVYPNPTKEKATVETKGVKMERIAIFNVLGQKIYEAPADSPYRHELDLSGVASGVYNVSVYTDKGMVTRKLNVIK
ncbi:MAG TPA: GEVED domain-containing protein [Edaphocola sp.]|nr:GEVED domain-containing protein [Edaphocola sp.]